MRKKTSIIWRLEKDEFQELLDSSESIVDILKKIGLDPYCGNHKTVHARIKQDNLNTDVFQRNCSIARSKRIELLGRSSKIPDEMVFCENSLYNRHGMKKRILDNKLMDYRCIECGVGDQYNGKPLALQLDHKNGVNNDNRVENLRFLCPNCHSQTETFGKKRFKKNKIYETTEAREKRLAKSRKFNPSRSELEKMVQELPLTKVGRVFGVSDNAVRKRCKRLGIEIRRCESSILSSRTSTKQ